MSIPQLADLLIERTQHSNWVVVYKSLITIHNLVNYGNEVCVSVTVPINYVLSHVGVCMHTLYLIHFVCIHVKRSVCVHVKG